MTNVRILILLLPLLLWSRWARSMTVPMTEAIREQKIALGQGYDARNGVFLERCWQGEIVYAGAQESRVDLSQALDEAEIQKDISASFEGGADLLIASGSVKTIISSKFHERSLRETAAYRVGVRGKSAILKSPTLKASYLAMKNADPERFKALCGDSYVNQAQLGGNLYFFVHYDFLNQEQYDKFKIQIKVKVMGYSKTKTINKEKFWADRSALVKIETLQIGGQQGHLQLAMQGYRSQCELADIASCAGLLDSLESYALGQTETSFFGQMSIKEFPRDIAEPWPSILSVRTTSVDPIPESRGSIELQRLDVSEKMSLMENDEAALREKLGQYPRDSQRYLELKQLLDYKIRSLKDRVVRFALLCLNNSQTTCNREDFVSDTQWKIYQTDRQKIWNDYTFVDYCLIPSRDEALERSVNAILDSLGISTRSTAGCEKGAKDLLALESLTLTRRGLSRIEPLYDAKNLKYLNLSFNTISDLSGIQKLSKLKILNIRSNAITTLYPLRGTNIKFLNAAYNQLTEVRALQGLIFETALFYGNHLSTVGDVPVSAAVLLRTEDELCGWQRQRMLGAGLISHQSFNAYASANFLPVVKNGAVDVKPCSVAAPNFDESTEQLFPSAI